MAQLSELVKSGAIDTVSVAITGSPFTANAYSSRRGWAPAGLAHAR